MRPGGGWHEWLQGMTGTSQAAGPATAGGKVEKKFNKTKYISLFFASYAAILAGVRMIDVSGASGQGTPVLQPFWDYLLKNHAWLVSHIGFAGLPALFMFWVSCFYFTYLDYIHADTKVQKDWYPSLKDQLRAAIPQSLTYIALNVGGYYYGYVLLSMPEEAPSLATFAEEVLKAFLIGDFFIYWEHRIMHMIPWLRVNIHSWHHHYHIPFGWAGGIVHPLEDAVVVACQWTAPIVLGYHPLSFWFFFFFWVHFLVEEHSGHDVWWAPWQWVPFAACPLGGGAAPHDIHHYKVTKNYAFVFCVWDQLFNSYEAVVEPPQRPNKESWWEFKEQKARELSNSGAPFRVKKLE